MSDQQPTSPLTGLLSSARGKLISALAVIALLLGIFAEVLLIYRNFWETGTSKQVSINSRERQEAEAKQAREQACIARIEKAMKYATLEELENNDIDLGDCDPHYAEKMQRKQACATKFTSLLDKNFPTKGFAVNGQTLKDDIESFKKTCTLTFELNEAFKVRADTLLRRIQEFKATDEGKACQAEVPKMIAELRSTGFTQRFNDTIKNHVDTCPPMTDEEKALLKSALDDWTAKNAVKEAIEKSLKLLIAADAEKDRGNFDQAFELAKQYVAATEALDLKTIGKPGKLTRGACITLSFYALFAKQHQAAIDAADRAIKLEPADLVPYTNRAHALMFLGRIDEARNLYLAHRGKKMGEHDWNYNIADDFKQLRAAGISHPLMDEIEAKLADGSPINVASTRGAQAPVRLTSDHETAEASDLHKRVLSFINEYHRVAASDMQQLGRFYADTVDYGQKGMTPRSLIMREKMEVVQVCPERSYRVLNDSLRIRQTGADRVDVDFDVDTICRGRRRETRRVWQNFISLDLSKGSPVIVAQRGSARQAE